MPPTVLETMHNKFFNIKTFMPTGPEIFRSILGILDRRESKEGITLNLKHISGFNFAPFVAGLCMRVRACFDGARVEVALPVIPRGNHG